MSLTIRDINGSNQPSFTSTLVSKNIITWPFSKYMNFTIWIYLFLFICAFSAPISFICQINSSSSSSGVRFKTLHMARSKIDCASLYTAITIEVDGNNCGYLISKQFRFRKTGSERFNRALSLAIILIWYSLNDNSTILSETFEFATGLPRKKNLKHKNRQNNLKIQLNIHSLNCPEIKTSFARQIRPIHIWKIFQFRCIRSMIMHIIVFHLEWPLCSQIVFNVIQQLILNDKCSSSKESAFNNHFLK